MDTVPSLLTACCEVALQCTRLSLSDYSDRSPNASCMAARRKVKKAACIRRCAVKSIQSQPCPRITPNYRNSRKCLITGTG